MKLGRDRRTWTFVLIGAILGAAIGLVYLDHFDLVCVPAPEVYGGGCWHDEIFGWQPGSLAVPVWIAIGIVGGAIVGVVAARVTRRT